MDRVRWGILGTGSIASKFARGLRESRTGTLTATGSRSAEKAAAFAAGHGGKPYRRYEDVLSDPAVQVVYLALPHHMHAEWTVRCAKAGKHILCEKPFALTAKQADDALREVEQAGVFFMEAFMYRCHPQTRELKQLIQAGAIGKPLLVNAEFGFSASRDWDNFRTVGELGGGGLMDVGTYCISMSRLIAGEEPTRCEYVAHLSPPPQEGRGGSYDEYGTGCLNFPSGMTAMMGTGIHASLRNEVMIYGDEGWIRLRSPWFCNGPIELYGKGKHRARYIRSWPDVDLYGEEADAVAEFIEQRECPYMTWDDTRGNARALDQMRESAGLSLG